MSLELGKRGEQVQLQAAGGGRGVDALAQRSERDLALLQSRDDVDQVPQAAAEAVQAPDDERVAGAAGAPSTRRAADGPGSTRTRRPGRRAHSRRARARRAEARGPARGWRRAHSRSGDRCARAYHLGQSPERPVGDRSRVRASRPRSPKSAWYRSSNGGIVSEPPDGAASRDVGLEASMWTGDEPGNSGITCRFPHSSARMSALLCTPAG